jgi:TPR repeat protein
VRRQRITLQTVEIYVGVAGGLLLAANAVAKLLGATWPWAITGAAVLAVLTGVFGTVINPFLHHRATLADAERARAEAADRVSDVLYGAPGPISQADPYEMGVFKSDAAEQASKGERPPYVERTIDKVLRPAITSMAKTGGLVVVRGDPKSGKSRTLWEALADQAGSRLVYGLRPSAGKLTPVETFVADTEEIDGQRSIIWIDDAHEHFGDGGLTNGILTRDLLGRHPGVIVAITVHTHRLRTPERAEGTGPAVEDLALIDRLRAASDPHELAVRWSDDELAQARVAYPGLEATVPDQDDFATLARWFAGVNYLRKRYRENRFVNCRGVAVAKAVIDWRRAGMPAGITTDQLEELARIVLPDVDDAGVERFDDDGQAFQDALAWATGKADLDAGRLRWKGVALVRPIKDTDPSRWRDFDAVTTWAPTANGGPDGPVSEASWSFILNHLTAHTGSAVGAAAYDADKKSIAESAFRRTIELAMNEGKWGHAATAMTNLGVLHYQRGGDTNIDEAERLYLQAAELDNADAMTNLGSLYRLRGGDTNLAEAERLYRQAAQLGHVGAMNDLGSLLRLRGGDANVDEAERLYLQAAQLGDANAMTNLGSLYRLRGGDTNLAEAERLYGQAVELGNANAMTNLGSLLYEHGSGADDHAEAERLWHRAAELGDAGAMTNLGVMLDERGGDTNVAEAERLHRRAAEVGNTGAIYNLGVMLDERGGDTNVAEAERLYRQAAEHGDAGAMNRLGVMLNERGLDDGRAEAERLWRQAAELGNTAAMYNLGAMLYERGGNTNVAEAERLWRQAAELGNAGAMDSFGAMLYERGGNTNVAEAERLWRQAAELGNAGAMNNLGAMLYERGGDRGEAERLYRQAAEHGDTRAIYNLGAMLYERGGNTNVAEAERLWRQAAELGNAGAMYSLGRLLYERGGDKNVAEAEWWFEQARRHGDENPH